VLPLTLVAILQFRNIFHYAHKQITVTLAKEEVTTQLCQNQLWTELLDWSMSLHKRSEHSWTWV